ncbi:predicted protein [Arabidopsis lyrata subsp. lyrata]|uniref:Predicted protein n=1 Tax=Arabidopsis lyrata subsp. lyrata TaxID=81972 RepID=D7MQ66_ARALL|nr:predicted protein [Arabidopsis lyrata subsp. lyrata]
MYLQWSNAEEDKDLALDNLIKDIIHNRLALDAWKGVPAFGVSKEKWKVKATVDEEGSITRKGKKIKKAECSGEERVKIQNEDEKIVSEDIQVDKDDKKSFSDILMMMEKLNGSIVDMGKNLSSRIDELENTFDSRIVAVETDLKELKHKKPASIPTDVANSINNEDEGASSKSPTSYSLSWKVEEKPSSVDGLPVQRVVKKTYTVQKKKDGSKAERKKSEKATLKEEATKAAKRGGSKPAVKAALKEKAAKNPGLKAVVKEEAVKKDGSKAAKKCATTAGNKMKKKSIIQGDDVVDITAQVEDEALKMVSSSEDTFSDPGLHHANKMLNATLIAMVENLKDLDEGVTVGRRVQQLAGSQKFPILANYDSKSRVAIRKIWMLKDYNMGVAMAMFHKRINISDSIPHLTTNPEMVKQCMFLREMIPAMMSAVIPDNIRKKSNARLEVKRITKKVSFNKDPGNCATYTLKYIECLALGKSFNGICDENINAIRIKLAAELFDEVRESARPSNLCGEDFQIPHLMDSP